MRVLILRLEAPLMSFGGTMVDKWGVITEFPAASLLTGLFANALGFDQSEADAHQRLQERLRFAARTDREGRRLVDYQTVELGQPQFTATGWTTRGEREDRGGGKASTGTHIRLRPYWADRRCIVACTLVPADEPPALDDLARAMRRPARPLFLGRKPCVPATRLLEGEPVEAPSLIGCLSAYPDTGGDRDERPPSRRVRAQWPAEEQGPPGDEEPFITDARDWRNQFHSGARPVRRGRITITRRRP